MRSYDEYQWEWLKSIELYEQWKKEDFHLLLEMETKAVRYVMHFIWDCLNKVEERRNMLSPEDGREFLELARKYLTWIAPEVRNSNLMKLVVERFKKLEGSE